MRTWGSAAVARRLATVGLVHALLAMPALARAAITCDAGAICPDRDNDGFAACGCAWSGSPCDCNDDDPAVFPGAPERCDATRDQDCSGVAPDPCARGTGCLMSTCVPECVPLDDFGCAGGSTFFRQLETGMCLCKPEDCTVFGCPAGETCDDAKTCVPICHPGVRCPRGQICRGFGCVDPCAEVTCPEGALCDRGRCVPSCACDGVPCPAGETCDRGQTLPACVETACLGVACPAGEHCEGGRCVDACAGVACPPKRVCRKTSVNGVARGARCVDLCSPDPCRPGTVCEWPTGACRMLPGADGGLVIEGAPDDVLVEVAGAGWLCTSTGFGRASTVTAILGGSAALLFLARRRRARRSGH